MSRSRPVTSRRSARRSCAADIADTDTAAAERVVVINQALALQYFEGQDPVGQRIAFAQPSPKTRWRTIVGVVADHVQDGLGTSVKGEIYDSIAQDEFTSMFVAIRTAPAAGGGSRVAAADVVAHLRRLIAARDPQIAAFDPEPFADRLAASVARERVAALLIGVFAAVALVLAVVGLYGVTACAVSARMREMGVRVACGATSADVRTLVVGSHLRLVVTGGVVGVIGDGRHARGVGAALRRAAAGRGQPRRRPRGARVRRAGRVPDPGASRRARGCRQRPAVVSRKPQAVMAHAARRKRSVVSRRP